MIKHNLKTGETTHDYTPEQIEMMFIEVVKHGAQYQLPEEEEKENV